ncbi:hypothetical protein K435DRAFT_863757 [Dendrothele bispora CBS 962.96]|uniref:Uncharacterized protein n=1 Tax=Dendrothele bispora (strain CBS 962.96) TaxID=1314807 RepID=A0A4S8LQ01_DENBC|nr:hypothetical protein K435DRAFT_863757 [Dendrothele bispora CBS 962.96]
MSTPHRSTVYDLSSLRLHRDGTSIRKSEKNKRLHHSKLAVRDSRGYWIARDAGGLVNVPQRYRTHAQTSTERDDTESNEEGLCLDGGREGQGTDDRGRKGNEKEITSDAEDADAYAETRNYKTSRAEARAEKRRKFMHDFDFLTPDTALSNNTTSRSGPVSPLRCDPPSSELLKCIHYLASRFYDEQGQLTNSSREYRKERKARRLAKFAKHRLAAKTKSKGHLKGDPDGSDIESSSASGLESSECSDKLSDLELDDRSSEDKGGVERPEDEMQSSAQRLASSAKGGGKSKVKRKQNRITDMYKTMDGSALMVIGKKPAPSDLSFFGIVDHFGTIGMLLQEHVSENLRPRIPELARPGDGDEDGEKEETTEVEANEVATFFLDQ